MVDRFAQFTGAVLELHRCINRIKEAEMAEWGLRGSHVMCLYYLGRYEEGLTAAQLTALCKEDKAAVSRTVSQLAERGLVCRVPSGAGSAYRAALCLTGQGKDLVCRINRKIEGVLSCSSRGIPDEKRDDLYRSLQVILENLERYVAQKEEGLSSPEGAPISGKKESEA